MLKRTFFHLSTIIIALVIFVSCTNKTPGEPTRDPADGGFEGGLPQPITALQVVASETELIIDLSWQHNDVENTASFKIERSEGGNQNFTTIDTVARNILSFSDSVNANPAIAALKQNTKYFYRVVAFNVKGDSKNNPEKFVATAGPRIGINPADSVRYDKLVLSSTQDTTFTITNDGLGQIPLTVSDIRLIGVNADRFSFSSPPRASFDLQVSETEIFDIRFTPTDAGAAMAKLLIVSNDASNDSLIVNLIGRGNTQPVANAGPGQTVVDDDNDNMEAVTLDGSGSFDPDSGFGGFVKAYSWRENGNEVATGVMPPVKLSVGTHTITLIVTDECDAVSDSSSVVIRVDANNSPMANAGDDQILCDVDGDGVEDVMLDGSASFDPDSSFGGFITTYSWIESGAEIASGVRPAKIPLTVGVHTITLRITDNGGAMGTDDVIITVTPNTPPMANAGPNQSGIVVVDGDSASVTLDGSESFDPDSGKGGSITAFSWLENNSEIAAGENPTVRLAVGDHTITLKVTDNGSEMGADDVFIEVDSNTPPMANAGNDQILCDVDGNGEQSVMLDGSKSFDPDSGIGGSIATYSWLESGAEIASGVRPAKIPLTVGVHTITLQITDNGSAMDTDDVVITVTPNTSPVTNAGPDQTGAIAVDGDSASVTLDGSGSFDPDSGKGGSITAFSWLENNIEIAAGKNPTVRLAVGDHTITLKVTDNGSEMGADDVFIEVDSNTPPVAEAGPNRMNITDVGGDGVEDVMLDGSGSFDPDSAIGGEIINYIWSENGTPLLNGIGENPTVNLTMGSHTIILTVTDNGDSTAMDSVMIMINGNTPPVASPGPDQTVIDVDGSGFETVTLDGSGSSDSNDGMIDTYSWLENGTEIATGVNPDVSLSIAGSPHTILLVVTDNGGATGTDSVMITVNENTRPIANAGGDTTLVDVNGDGSVLVTLDGSASFDSSGGTIENYSWKDNGVDIPNAINLEDSVVTVPLDTGNHTIILTVTDNGSATDTDTVTIPINPNTPPMAVIPQTLEVPDLNGDGMESVILDGSMSFDPDSGVTEADLKGAIAAYLWEDITTAGNPVPLGSDSVITAVLDSGVHTIRLTVTDNGGAIGSAIMTVTVKEIELNIVPSKWYFGTLQARLVDSVPSDNDFTVSNISQSFTLALEAKLMQGSSLEFELINDDITLAPGADWTPRVRFSPDSSGELRRIEDVLQNC